MSVAVVAGDAPPASPPPSAHPPWLASLQLPSQRWFYLLIACYLAAVAGFTASIVLHQQSLGASVALQVARVGGGQLNLHAALSTWTMLRKTHMFLARSAPSLTLALGMDHNVLMHRTLGMATVGWAVVHVCGHAAVAAQATSDPVGYVFGESYVGFGLLSTTPAGPSGVALCVFLLFISTGYALRKSPLLARIDSALGWGPRPAGARGGGGAKSLQPASTRGSAPRAPPPPPGWCARHAFELFTWTHWLVLPYYIAMVLHAPSCWKWLVGPVGLLLLEWAARFAFSFSGAPPFLIRVLPMGVLELVLERPPGFGEFSVGSYAWIKVPHVSPTEWHPFSISASAERGDGTLSFHIRCHGSSTWTGRLRAAVETERAAQCAAEKLKSKRMLSAGQRFGMSEVRFSPTSSFRVHVDGPYYAPSMQLFNTQHAILVLGGIGVTPGAAILESVVERCRTQVLDNGLSRVHALRRLQRLDFVWANNDAECTSWFVPLLAHVEEEQVANPDGALAKVLHVSLFLTSVPEGAGNEAMLLHLGVDALIGAKVAAHPAEPLAPHATAPSEGRHKQLRNVKLGRPNWDVLLKRLKGEFPARPQDRCVYFCGPPGMQSGVQAASIRHGINFRSESFA